MRFKVGIFATTVAVLLLMAGTSLAGEDEIVMKTGKVLSGKIIERTERGIRMQVDGLGKMIVPFDNIRSVNGKEFEPAPEEPADPEEPETPENPEKPEVPETPETPETPEEPKTPEQPEKPADPKPPVSPVDVKYGDLKKGMTLLFILAGEDHGDWKESGRRVIAEVALVGRKRVKIITDPRAGILGEEWVKREKLRRAIRLDDRPERRLLFFSDGVSSGSWIRGKTADGREFEGELGGVTADGSMTVWHPEVDRVLKTEVRLVELLNLSAITRSKDLHRRLDGLIAGEPVEIAVHGSDKPLAGRIRSLDRRWLTIETGDPRTGKTGEHHFFRGLPVTGLKTLPEGSRQALENATKETWLTLGVVTEDEETIQTRAATGRYVYASLSEIAIETGEGLESFEAGTVKSIEIPPTERLPALTARKDSSTAETILPVLPGMSRKEVEQRLPIGVEGIDILYDEDDRVATVYCRPPYPGPVFGVKIGSNLSQALVATDLVFDLQIDPKDRESEPVTTMVSHTLKPYLVKLLVSNTGEVMAAEIASR